jgi:peptide/nickel transport system substrate-binding protein
MRKNRQKTIRKGEARMNVKTRACAVVFGFVLIIGIATSGSSFAQTPETSPSQGASASSAKTTFIFGDTSEPSSLNPTKGYLSTDYIIWSMSYDLLLNAAADDFSPQPGLVTSIDASEDGMTFTMHVREGVQWSDGEPLTADDIAWTLNFYKENRVYNYISDLELMDKATATDDHTVVLTTTTPTPLYSGKTFYMYEYILPEHIWSEFEDYKDFKGYPAVGSGPYVIKDYVNGQSVTLERNPYYYGPKPQYDEIIYRIFNNEDAEAQALRSGEIQFAYLDSANIANSLANSPNISVRGAVTPSFDEIGMNTGSAYYPETKDYTPHGDGARALTDVNVRRAIRMAIDSKTLTEKIQLGYGEPATTIVPPVSAPGMYASPSAEEVIQWDIPGANALLEESGYTDTDGDGVRNDPQTGDNLEFRYYTRSSDQNTIKTAPFVQDWLEQIGIKTDVQSYSSGKLGTIINQGNYDLYDWGWYPAPDPDSILTYMTCGQRPPDGQKYGNNDSYYCNPEYDKLVEAQKSELDPVKRQELIHQAQLMFYQDAAYSVKWYAPDLEAYRTDLVTGFQPQPAGETGDLLATYGPYSWVSIQPATGASGTEVTKGIPVGIWIGLVVAVIVVVGAVVLLRRRGGRAEEDKA